MLTSPALLTTSKQLFTNTINRKTKQNYSVSYKMRLGKWRLSRSANGNRLMANSCLAGVDLIRNERRVTLLSVENRCRLDEQIFLTWRLQQLVARLELELNGLKRPKARWKTFLFTLLTIVLKVPGRVIAATKTECTNYNVKSSKVTK